MCEKKNTLKMIDRASAIFSTEKICVALQVKVRDFFKSVIKRLRDRGTKNSSNKVYFGFNLSRHIKSVWRMKSHPNVIPSLKARSLFLDL